MPEPAELDLVLRQFLADAERVPYRVDGAGDSLADYLIMARDTEERSGLDWITNLGALNLWGVTKLSPHGKEMQKGDRAIFYWTSKKSFVGHCMISEEPASIDGMMSTPLLVGSKYQIHITDLQLWSTVLPNHVVHAKGVGIVWSPGSLLRLKPGQYEALLTLAKEQTEAPEPVPSPSLDTAKEPTSNDHAQLQADLAVLGIGFGFRVWIPKSDQTRVLALNSEIKEFLVEHPALGAGSAKYTAEIDCIWYQDEQVMAAFEVEATTSIYSGLLRMADLVVLYPNITFDLFIVAPVERKEKFVTQVRRPVFTKMKTPLMAKCGFLSFDQIKATLDLQKKAKGHLQMTIMGDEAHWEV